MNKTKLDFKEFGWRVQQVREHVLKMTQKQLAPHLNIDQALLSRLERGVGGSTPVVFALVNFLEEKNFLGYMLFRNPFDINLFAKVEFVADKEKILLEVNKLEKSFEKNLEKIISLKEILSEI